MKKRLLWITQTAVMLALLLVLQVLTKPMGQLVTGTCVNLILAVTALAAGPASGMTVALISPVLAFVLGIAPQVLTVPAIMAGNTVYVVLLSLLAGKDRKNLTRQICAWLLAAVAKFVVIYGIVVGLICGVLADKLISAGTLKPPMLQVLSASFSWPQLVTALIGGGLALMIAPILRKTLEKS